MNRCDWVGLYARMANRPVCLRSCRAAARPRAVAPSGSDAHPPYECEWRRFL